METGQKLRQEFYKEGRLHGQSILWTHGLLVVSESNYKDGVPHGKWLYYDNNGNIIMETTYKNGKKVKELINK